MIVPVWKQRIQRSLHLGRSKHESKYFQVASVNNAGSPKVRTMVFRGFGKQHCLFAVTDIRSDKVEDFKHQAQVQICWYFAKTREQYRLDCSVECITEGQIYTEYWDKLSESAQLSFYAPAPKVPFDNSIDAQEKESSTNKQNAISEHFAVIRFKPNFSDYLDLKSKPQQRELEQLEPSLNQWQLTRVNP
jgi:PPOX class probable FMN-dependent enzyme